MKAAKNEEMENWAGETHPWIRQGCRMAVACAVGGTRKTSAHGAWTGVPGPAGVPGAVLCGWFCWIAGASGESRGRVSA